MDIDFRINSENLDDGTMMRTGTAFVTMVALDKGGRPTEVPPLLLETQEDHRHFKEGEVRMQSRLREAGRV